MGVEITVGSERLVCLSSLIFMLLFLLFWVCSEWLAPRAFSSMGGRVLGKSECRVVRKLGTFAEYFRKITEFQGKDRRERG